MFFIGSLVYLNVVIFSDNPSDETLQALEQDKKTSSLKDPMADTDNDGLLNWEEDLYGTSKKSSDSDGDGVSDGQEVALGTDPRSFLPVRDDTIIVSEDVETYEFQQIDNPQSVQALINNLVQIQNQESNIGEISLTGENTAVLGVNTDSREQVRSCINQFAIVVDNSLVTSAQDMAVLQNYVTGSTTNTFALEELIAANKQARDNMKNIDAASCGFMSKQLTQMSAVYTQFTTTLEQALAQGPVSGEDYNYQVWVDYAEQANAWVGIMNDMRVLVSGSGVVFEKNEPGYIFTQAPGA